MEFFNNLSKTEKLQNGTTETFFIGSPEAEGESTDTSRMKLSDIFVDSHRVFSELSNEKFIITGRKGSGKSAIAEYILHKASMESNVFCDFVKTRDYDIHKIIQIGNENGTPIEEKLIFEWIILTKLVLLLTKDQSLRNYEELKKLKTFLDNNIGVIDIRGLEIEKIVTNKSLEIDIESFKAIFGSILKKETGITSKKAPFYKLLPLLRQTVIQLLNESSANGNDYCLIFDDLDIGFKESDKDSIENLTNLLRVAKDYNIDFFGKPGLKGKVIILLRDDLKRIIVKYNADTAKIFSSYEIPLIWYEHDKFENNNENAIALKQLINKRIEVNFRKNDMEFDENDSWKSLVKFDVYNSTSTFKYVVDHTFFRPRDIILFFKPLPDLKFRIPLSKSNIDKLIIKYADEVVFELKNELSASFSKSDIDKIFLALKNLIRSIPFSKDKLMDEFKKLELEYDPELVILHLFDYSIIGNIDPTEGSSKSYFKHTERIEEPTNINSDMNFIYHQAIHTYLDSKV